MAISQKIVHLVRRFSDENWGSTENVVRHTSQSLVKHGIATTILSTSALAQTGSDHDCHVSISRFNYFYPSLGLSKAKKNTLDLKGGNPYSFGLFKALMNVSCRIIHCHTLGRLAATARIVSKQRNIPYVVTLHSGLATIPKSEMDQLSGTTKGSLNYGKLLDIVTRPDRVVKDASGIICIGYDEFLSIKKQFPYKPCLYLPNGVDMENFKSPQKNEFRQQYNIDANSKLILCVSRIDTQKNQMLLLDLLNGLNKYEEQNYHLLLIGAISNPTYFDALQHKIDQLKLNYNVTIIPGLAHNSPELVSAYHSADFFILPSIHEPFGIVVLEAWAAGLPVISSRVGGLNKLIENNSSGLFFNPYEKSSLIDTFNQLNRDQSLQNKLIKNGLYQAKTYYSWTNHIQKLLQFYQEVEIWHQSQHTTSLTC